MKLALLTAIAAVSALPIAAAGQNTATAQSSAAATDSKAITLRGCVTPGQDKGTYVLTKLTEMPQAGRSAIPDTAHGRRVVFWLDKDAEMLKHANSAVEVKGTITGAEESEIELKSGDRKDGGLLAEFEGPGKDVRVANEAVAGAIGTSGRTTPDKNDIKTILMKVKVDSVQATDYSCREQPPQQQQR